MRMSPLNGFDPFPMIADVKEGVETYLPESVDMVSIIFESTAVLHLGSTVIRSLPYIGKASVLRMNDLCHFLSVRVIYFEAAFICLASAVHNLFMAFLYTGLMILTLGFSQNINYACKKHWLHTVFSTAGVGIGVIGTFVPTLGALGTVGCFKILWNELVVGYRSDVKNFEDPLIREIKNVYHQNREQITEAVHTYVNDEYRFGLINPFLDEFSKNLHTVKTIDQFTDLVSTTFEKCSTPPSTKEEIPPTPRKQ